VVSWSSRSKDSYPIPRPRSSSTASRAAGHRAARTLLGMGYPKVREIEGGLVLWIEEGLPLRNQYGEVKVTDFVEKDPYFPLRD
jgi:3-mercaptopyruvate sulfurtransferase SseA